MNFAPSMQIARNTLLSPTGLNDNMIERVFGTILAHRADYADLYFQYSRSEGWSLEEGQVKSGSFSIDQGVGVRVVSGEKTAFAYSDDINFAALESAARATRSIAQAGASGTTAVAASPVGRDLYTSADPVSGLSDGDKVQILERLEGFARAIDPQSRSSPRRRR